jgi:purine-binding chemotaxis protein CheW
MNVIPGLSPRTLLIFDLDDARFGVDATLVRESVWLPKLTPVEEAPPYIVGIFSLRGQIVPVTDLNLRFGHPARPYRLSDQIVILELDQCLMGLIVSEVREVTELSAEAIQAPPKFVVDAPVDATLVEAQGRVGDDIVMLLDARQVTLLDARQLMYLPQELAQTESEQLSPVRHFCPQATPEQHAVFRARAKALMEVVSEEEGARLSLAVVELGGEYFGIELEAVQEFCDIVRPCPIPCCPPHILGAVSLRGNLITLLDLRAALNLPRAPQSSDKAVIVRASTKLGTGLVEQAVGVAVDQVHDVIYLREEELQILPAALREQHAAEVRGTAPYAGRMITVLNLSALLAREEWIVNETV